MYEKNSNELIAVQNLSAGITHQLNTSLTSALSNLEILLSDVNALDENIKSKEYIIESANLIQDSLYKISSIVTLLHELSAKLYEEPQECDVYELLEDAISTIEPHFKDIATILLNGSHIVTKIQKDRLLVVFKIIINNAIDSFKRVDTIQKHFLKIDICKNDENIVISFEDSGDGIDPYMLEHIFEPFATKRKDGGLGIGLKVAKNIVDSHNAKLTATNTDSGALFQLFLPFK